MIQKPDYPAIIAEIRNKHAVKQQQLQKQLQEIASDPEGLVALLQMPEYHNTEQTVHSLKQILKGLNT